jgi:hypothetical protein
MRAGDYRDVVFRFNSERAARLDQLRVWHGLSATAPVTQCWARRFGSFSLHNGWTRKDGRRRYGRLVEPLLGGRAAGVGDLALDDVSLGGGRERRADRGDQSG